MLPEQTFWSQQQIVPAGGVVVFEQHVAGGRHARLRSNFVLVPLTVVVDVEERIPPSEDSPAKKNTATATTTSTTIMIMPIVDIAISIKI